MRRYTKSVTMIMMMLTTMHIILHVSGFKLCSAPADCLAFPQHKSSSSYPYPSSTAVVVCISIIFHSAKIHSDIIHVSWLWYDNCWASLLDNFTLVFSCTQEKSVSIFFIVWQNTPFAAATVTISLSMCTTYEYNRICVWYALRFI